MFTEQKQEKHTKIKLLGELSLEKTFDCGQAFRFEKVESARHGHEFAGVAYGRHVSFAQKGDELYIYGADEEDFEKIWRRYLGLDTDYEKINADILSRSDNPALKNALEFGRGIRILRQEPWEAVCSFIISQNNNIPRIKKIIRAMSEKYGTHLGGDNYAFPTAKALHEAGEAELFALKTGFRAKYLADASARFVDGRLDLEKINEIPSTAECVKKLCEVKGIGPKVASCALLFGFGRLDAFPVDVWIRRVMEKYFDPDFDIAQLGPYAGVAQQYLFYYERYLGGE